MLEAIYSCACITLNNGGVILYQQENVTNWPVKVQWLGQEFHNTVFYVLAWYNKDDGIGMVFNTVAFNARVIVRGLEYGWIVLRPISSFMDTVVVKSLRPPLRKCTFSSERSDCIKNEIDCIILRHPFAGLLCSLSNWQSRSKHFIKPYVALFCLCLYPRKLLKNRHSLKSKRLNS